MKTLTIVLLLSSLLVSCAGEKSNPLDKYPGLKSTEPSNEKAKTQTIIQPDIFEIEVNGSNQVNQGQFVEGQKSETLLRVISKSLKVQSYKIDMTDFSSIERPVLTPTAEPHIFSLQWTPPVGIIPAGQWGKSFSAKFIITVMTAENPLLIGATKVKEISVVVNRNNTQPKIIGRTDLKAGLDEQQKISFSIDIEDPAGANNPRLPELQVTPYIYSNTEAYRADISHNVMFDSSKQNNPEKIGLDKFRFYYVIDLDRLPLDRDRLGHEVPNAATVDVCFQMRAVSAVGTLSEQLQVCSVARYASQPPQFIYNKSTLEQIKAGQENLISLTVRADHSLSQITLKNATQQIAGLSGQKSISCQYTSPEKANELICQLKWTPLCPKVDSKKSLLLKADNVVSSKSKSSSETLEFTIGANPEICNKPKEGSKP